MFWEIILPIFRSPTLCVTACGIMHQRCCRPLAGNIVGALYITSCNTQSSAPEDGQNNCLKHVELTGIINKPLLLHLVGCLCYLYQWCTVKQISDNEIYLLIKYVKSGLWRVAKHLSYIEDARCLKVNRVEILYQRISLLRFKFFCPLYTGTAVAQWLRCCATNLKVAGSIPVGFIGIFHSHNSSDHTMALWSTQPLTEMSTGRDFLGVNAAGA